MKSSNTISWIAIILSICALGVSFVRTEPFTIDSLGFFGWTVAALAILVTLLLGWQIYSAIDMKKIAKQIEVKSAEMEINNSNSISAMNCSVYGALLESDTPEGSDPFKFLNYSLLVLIHAEKLNNTLLCEQCIKNALKRMPDKLILTKLAKYELIKLLYSIYDGERLQGFLKLREIIVDAEIRYFS